MQQQRMLFDLLAHTVACLLLLLADSLLTCCLSWSIIMSSAQARGLTTAVICPCFPSLQHRPGPAQAYVTAFVQTHGKALGEAGGIRGCLQHKDALLDPQGALGRMLIQRFTLGGETFPGPCSAALREIMLFPGRGSRDAITYAGHKGRFKKLFKANDVEIQKKTHACRQYSARAADEAGLPDDVSPACGLPGPLLLPKNSSVCLMITACLCAPAVQSACFLLAGAGWLVCFFHQLNFSCNCPVGQCGRSAMQLNCM
jgi:hypothetical protein